MSKVVIFHTNFSKFSLSALTKKVFMLRFLVFRSVWKNFTPDVSPWCYNGIFLFKKCICRHLAEGSSRGIDERDKSNIKEIKSISFWVKFLGVETCSTSGVFFIKINSLGILRLSIHTKKSYVSCSLRGAYQHFKGDLLKPKKWLFKMYHMIYQSILNLILISKMYFVYLSWIFLFLIRFQPVAILGVKKSAKSVNTLVDGRGTHTVYTVYTLFS